MKTEYAKFRRWRWVVLLNIGIGILSALWSLYWREWLAAVMEGSGALAFGIALYLAGNHYERSGRP